MSILCNDPKVKKEQHKNQRILMFWSLLLLPIALIVMSKTDYIPFTWYTILGTVVLTYIIYGFMCMRIGYKIECHYNPDPPDYIKWLDCVSNDFWWFEEAKEDVEEKDVAPIKAKVQRNTMDTVNGTVKRPEPIEPVVKEISVSKVLQAMLLYQTSNTKTISVEYMNMVIADAMVEVKNAK